ncbi:hypothetical protein I6F35_33540 [Bradyrhizobium sp. BRP22]|uniref:hypothetical protein n=1 Tax=Bradyrhizobium sp. BRP22 TaxID=2793821 RepID=UPI001CD6D657|nr:hypothetical protein [Bradyrhizobium sp. BRP22]MCA1458059.1 hypothetical protein [Bradyrhizobium sp. BRP22]
MTPMLVTEEEARSKRCQESFGDGSVSAGAAQAMGVPVNPFSHGFSPASMVHASPHNCIGSACMAWRWMQVLASNGMDVVQDSRGRGYCGKAGRP